MYVPYSIKEKQQNQKTKRYNKKQITQQKKGIKRN
jgi:hypothetical protein